MLAVPAMLRLVIFTPGMPAVPKSSAGAASGSGAGRGLAITRERRERRVILEKCMIGCICDCRFVGSF